MLWLCITLPQLPLEALQCEHSETATVVTVLEGNVRSVVCCNPAAERVGLKPAMNFTTAIAVLPELIALERRPSAEQAALERLAVWAYQFSGTVIPGKSSPICGALELRRCGWRSARACVCSAASVNSSNSWRPS